MNEGQLQIAVAEYLRLLRVPIGSDERHRNHGTMAFLRDFIAYMTGRSSEEVQTAFEETVAKCTKNT